MLIKNIIDNGHVNNLPFKEQNRLWKARLRHDKRAKTKASTTQANPQEISSQLRTQRRQQWTTLGDALNHADIK